MKLLFVEDNARFARLARAQYLANYDVIEVPSVAAALEKLAETAFEVVLLDFDLSDGKGSLVARKASQLVPKPFLIAISSHQEGKAQLMDAGADVICSKMRFSTIISVLEARFGTPGDS